MSQSWDNVASMHKLFTVSSYTQKTASSMSTVSTLHMQQHELHTLNQLLSRPPLDAGQ